MLFILPIIKWVVIIEQKLLCVKIKTEYEQEYNIYNMMSKYGKMVKRSESGILVKNRSNFVKFFYSIDAVSVTFYKR
jgi:hypothetical protein